MAKNAIGSNVVVIVVIVVIGNNITDTNGKGNLMS
jgi:hypothetical protein